MESIPHPNDASDEIWLWSASWSLRYLCLKMWTDGRTDERMPTRLPSYKLTLSLWLWWAKNHKIAFSYVTSGIIWKINMQELWFLCMTRRLNVLYKGMIFCWNTSKGYQVIERTRNSIANDQREITPKYPKQTYGSCAWHIVSLCSRSVWSFNQIALTVFNLQSGQKIAFSYVTRGTIWKINIQELWFLCMTCRLNVLYKCMKFCWTISNSYQVI